MKIYQIITSIFLVMLVQFKANSQSPSFKTYMNPVIPGDHPDCTISKIGTYFYTTGSSFNVTPTIYQSTDLVHWKAIARPVSASWSNFDDFPGGGCWGGHVVFYNNKYWDFFSRGNTMYYVTADTPEGTWTTPVKVNNPTQLPYGLGYDNSIFIDEDGKWYLVVKNGQPNNGIVELGTNGQPTGVVYNLNWLNPSPGFPYSWAEGPVMWKYNGYYYYSFARDVSGGQKVMRSKTLTADQSAWEILGDFFNESDPAKSSSLFSGPNHASNVTMLEDSTSWTLHPVYAKGEWRGQGRQGLLNQVKYNSIGKPTADYPVNKYFTAPNLSSSGIPWMVPKSDFFTDSKINAEWSMLGSVADSKFSLTEKPGWLRISPKTSKLNTLTKNDGEHNYSVITKVDFTATVAADEAGLIILRGDEKSSLKLSSSANANGKSLIKLVHDTISFETANTIGNIVWLKLIRANHKIRGYFSSNGIDWTQVGNEIDIASIDKFSDFSSWTGTRQGLYVQNKSAYFDLYIYRDAFSDIQADCPANQYGTCRTLLTSTTGALDYIHDKDWALYAGVEFGNSDYRGNAKSIEFNAACSGSGTVQVWLDSIGTGTKIAECSITSTGSNSMYKTFSTILMSDISGCHDVYLYFINSISVSLFRLNYFKFSSSTVTAIEDMKEKFTVKLFPNPAKDKFSIQSDFSFNKITITNLEGKKVFSETLPIAVDYKIITAKLPKGLFVVKLENKMKVATVKLAIE